MDKFKSLLASRKFWAALVGVVLVAVKSFKPDFPLTDGQVTEVVYVIVAYILGTAVESGLRK